MRSIIIIFSYALRAYEYNKLIEFLHFLPNILAVNWMTIRPSSNMQLAAPVVSFSAAIAFKIV